MPLRGLLDGAAIHACFLSPARWARLEAEYRDRDLRLPCCGQKARPKTNSSGLRYFVHIKRNGCSSPEERAEELRGRTSVALAVRDAGWQVTTEYHGHTPDGQSWQADILAQRGEERYAFQLCWAPQAAPEVVAKHKRMVLSGIRPIWFQRLYRGRSYNLDLHEWTLSDRPKYPVFGIASNRQKTELRVPRFRVSLRTFIRSTLAGNLAWGPQDDDVAFAEVLVQQVSCWRCGKPMGIILGLQLRAKEGHLLDLLPFGTEGVPQLLQARLPTEFFVRHQMLPPKTRYSDPRELEYLSNGCPHKKCEKLFGDWYIEEKIHELRTADRLPEPVLELEIILGRDLPNPYSTWRLKHRAGLSQFTTPRKP